MFYHFAADIVSPTKPRFAKYGRFVCLLYDHGKQLRLCWDGQLLNHTVLGQASRRQFTSIKCPFFQLALLESAEEGNYFSMKECAGREDRSWDRCLRGGHATDRATAPGQVWRESNYVNAHTRLKLCWLCWLFRHVVVHFF